MENLTIILALVFLVFGVLQIILFFKVWEMTNDVRKIKKQFITESKEDIVKEIVKGNPDISSILFDNMYEDLRNSTQDNYFSVVNQYRAYYKRAGVPIPEALEGIKCHNDWRNLNSCE